MQTQHSISQDISLSLTITYMNTKEKVKCRKLKASQWISYFHQLLMFYYAWRNKSELMAAHQSYTSKFYEPNVQEVVE